MHAMSWVRGATLAALVILAIPAVAWAGIEGPCTGSLTIQGVTYGPQNDTPANPIIIPDEPGLSGEWTGSTQGTVITDHRGQIGVVVGPGAIPVASWSGENAEEETETSGSYSIDDAKELIPFDLVGLYELRGFHRGEGGECRGNVMVEVQGNPLTTPLGLTALAGLVASGVGMVVAARGRP